MITFIDLFCGIGGFHYAMKQVEPDAVCLFACDIDKNARKMYAENFGIILHGDIMEVTEFPHVDILCAGFPCQPFSTAGRRTGKDHKYGDLFTEVARAISISKPRAILLENVAALTHKNNRAYFDFIIATLEGLGYTVKYSILDAQNFGLPQRRKRLFIVGFLDDGCGDAFEFPAGDECKRSCIEDILEHDVDPSWYITFERHEYNVFHRRMSKLRGWSFSYGVEPVKNVFPTIVTKKHERNMISQKGLRYLTHREAARCQGFHDNFKIPEETTIAYRLIGNSIPVNVVSSIITNIFEVLKCQNMIKE